MESDKIKLQEWLNANHKNIRGLLCSLDQVLWEGETKWKGCTMHELVTAEQVKKHYRKAVVIVHPDKVSYHGYPYERVAKTIFFYLTEAWETFENEGMKPLDPYTLR